MVGKRRAAGPAVKRPAQASGGVQARIKKILKWTLIVGLIGALMAVGAFVYLYRTIDVPNPNEDFQTETSFVYFDDGETELGRFATQNRESIPYEEMPKSVRDAVVAAENQTFWTDNGIDPKGILRAAFSNASGNSTQGASTITQQYVKILYLTQERSYTRKLKEAILSLKIQRQISKEKVLEGYLNTIYFGRGAYGVQAAAKAYFDLPAGELNLRQSAVLASVINNPSAFDPANGRAARKALRERYDYTLTNMADLDQIPTDEAEQAKKALPAFPELEVEATYGGQKGHVLELVRQELVRLGFDEEEIDGGGLRVTTTFTAKAMAAAEQGVLEAKPEGFGDKELHIGAASVEPGTGAVRGLYGGQDYLDSQLNWAVEGGQAGSAFKPFALSAAINDGFSLKDTFDGNSPYELPDGTDVENQGDTSYGGAIDLIQATEDSVNTAYIDMTLAMEDGPQKIIDMANAMGVPPEQPSPAYFGYPRRTPGLLPNTGVALGSQTLSPINMANGYATIANGGVSVEPFIISKVVDRQGKTRYEHKAAGTRAMSEDIASDVSYAMQQVVRSGSGTAALALGRPAAGKTGTATNSTGAVSSSWFAGFTPQLATAVVYVRGDGDDQLDGWLPEYFGGSFPAETWTAIMQKALLGLPVEEFPPPAFVDGEAPDSGHEPYTPPPPPTTTAPPPPPRSNGPTSPPPSTTEEPSQDPTPSQTKPTKTPPTTPPTCNPLDCPSESLPPGGGGNGGDPPGNRERSMSLTRETAGGGRAGAR